VPRRQDTCLATRIDSVGRVALRGEAEVGERALAVHVDDEPRHLGAALLGERAPTSRLSGILKN
jgi:hypothetical protein